MSKKVRIVIGVIVGVLLSISIAVSIPFIIYGVNSKSIERDWRYLKEDPKYIEKVEVTGLTLVTQQVSCGYATIEMISTYYDEKVTEEELNKRNSGNITTSSTDGFFRELTSSIKTTSFIKKTYVPFDSYLKDIYYALSNSKPVMIEWAAKYNNDWTLHFSIVTALDLYNDNVTIYNPYGYIENISVSEFLNRTSFVSYSNMPLFLSFGFAFGAFHKNTLFY